MQFEPNLPVFRQQIPCGQQDACGGRKQECRSRTVGFQKFEAFASVRFPEKLDDGERKGRSETDQQKTFSQREEAEARQDKHAIDRFGDPDCENLPPPVVLSQA